MFRADKTDIGVKALEQAGVGTGDARMSDVAADRDGEALKRAELRPDRHRVKERLGRMLKLAGAAIDDGAGERLVEGVVKVFLFRAHDHYMGAHGGHGLGRIDHGLAFVDRRCGDRHVDDVGAEFFSGELEGQIGAG